MIVARLGIRQRLRRRLEFLPGSGRLTEKWIRTCTIITGEPNELVAQIHPRKLVIIPEQHHTAWLGETDDANVKELPVPYPARVHPLALA